MGALFNNDKSYLRGLQLITEHIAKHPQKYAKNTGAQFLANLYCIDQDSAAGYLDRLEKKGPKLDLSEHENAIYQALSERHTPLELIVMDTGMTRRSFIGKVAKSAAILASSAGAIRYVSHHAADTKSQTAESGPTPDTPRPAFKALQELLDSTQEQIEKSETLKELVSALKTAGIVGGIAFIVKSIQMLSEAGKILIGMPMQSLPASMKTYPSTSTAYIKQGKLTDNPNNY